MREYVHYVVCIEPFILLYPVSKKYHICINIPKDSTTAFLYRDVYRRGVFVYRPDPVLPHFTEIGSTSHVFVWEMQDIVAKFSHSKGSKTRF